MRSLCDTFTLDQARLLHVYFDERGTGKISVSELSMALQDLINQQIGGGIFAFMQVKPIIQKIIGQLAIDCDKFFDEVADKNEALLKEEQHLMMEIRAKRDEDAPKKRSAAFSRDASCGLSKRLFFSMLIDYGVYLSEQDKALACQVFALDGAADKLDYLKLD